MISIVMGSASDQKIADKITSKLDEFQVEYELRIISAHRAIDVLIDYVKNSESDVFISIAGMAAHLGGVIAAITTKPVIGVPASSANLDGLDSLLSTVQMPKGVPVATVAIDGGENAAILACEILALKDEQLKEKLEQFRKEQKEKSVK
ncbi:MAG: 5-(carboxyamino)imidazole ribonucleotide mutase [Peptoniphilaceae bacterium]|nr:5-(carboxyamino)imidazole ribonucleotide mutase [Peptoniphilaceae bacterium]MDY3738627.1 5-(carboxyamino)imidazole ribonucleotide mutase [Peptoniphilaceae bacterium]